MNLTFSVALSFYWIRTCAWDTSSLIVDLFNRRRDAKAQHPTATDTVAAQSISGSLRSDDQSDAR
jgi:hypothetical protein